MMTPTELVLLVPSDEPSERLDRWLASRLENQSRSALKRLIDDERVLVDGLPARASQPIEAGQTIHISIPSPQPSRLEAEALPLQIIYEDADLLVVDKAAGQVVHPAPGHNSGTLVNAILHHVPDLEGVGGERRPGIVHRLDKETSGLLVVAKKSEVHRFLQEQFAQRTVLKEYIALLEGTIVPEQGRISAPIGRHPKHRKRMAVLPPHPQTGEPRGREALTDYRVEARFSRRLKSGTANFSLVRTQIHSGRTHQIRVHFAWMKHPVVGDTLYGYRRQRLKLDRHFLHAARLGLQLPDGEEKVFEAPLPSELAQILTLLTEND